MHVDDLLLESLLAGELGAAAAAEARHHIDGCPECRRKLEQRLAEEQWIEGLLRSIDHPAPRIPATQVVERARSRPRRIRWAAAIALFLVAAGTAYALPGSPLRYWVDRLVGRAAPALLQPEPPFDAAGVVIAPGQHFTIVFPARAPRELTIALFDGASIDVRTRSTGNAKFTAELGRLLVEPDSVPTDFLITIPRTAPWVEVVVGRRRIFWKDGPRVIADAEANQQGRYVIRF